MSNTSYIDQSANQSFGHNASDIVSLVALIISLAAFATTVLQVLQQYLASADGYRRCAPSVIGPWSRGTHRRFRGRELRFEVVFETPVIFLAPPDNEKGPIYGRKIHNLDGSDASYDESNTLKPDKERIQNISTADDERASWVTLLAALQKSEADSREHEGKLRTSPRGVAYKTPSYTICYSIQKKTRSYDFMPPAVTKPYATTTISHLVEMTGMLGMFWKAFDVTKGNVRAEGNGYIITSTLVHGLGLLTTFSVTGPSQFTEKRVIPFHEVKELVFGFVPSIISPPLELSDPERARRTLRALKCKEELISLYEAKKDRVYMFSVSFELIGLLAQTFRLRRSVLYMLPNPTADRWPGNTSIIEWWGEMKAYEDCLERLLASSSTPDTPRGALIKLISEHVRKINTSWTKKEGDLDVREEIHNALDEVNEQLNDLKTFSHKEITSVLASHLQTILACTDDIQSSLINHNTNSPPGTLTKCYFDTVLASVQMGDLDLDDEQKSKRGVIWLGLIFRMICWFSLHDFDKNDVNMMPADMKGSRMPIFIG